MQLSSIFVCALAVAAANITAAQPQPQATFGAAQALQSVTMKADLAAVWQSPQQGYVIDLRGRNPRAFHSTADACWLDAQLQKALPS